MTTPEDATPADTPPAETTEVVAEFTDAKGYTFVMPPAKGKGSRTGAPQLVEEAIAEPNAPTKPVKPTSRRKKI